MFVENQDQNQWHLAEKNGTRVEVRLMGGEDHQLCPQLSLGPRADNVTVPLDLTQS